MADPGGGGDNSESTGSQSFEWVKLPLLVQENVFKYLPRCSLNRMRQTCRENRYTIDREYGIHVILPARNLSKASIDRGATVRPGYHITDWMIQTAMLAMEGKVIRTLDMFEVPALLNPFPFQRLIQRPMRLRHLRLKYIDVRLIHTFLTSCRNLRTLQYETWYHRFMGMEEALRPEQIPSTNGQFIALVQELPALVQLRHLTSLTLSFTNVHQGNQSDWANPLYLLIALPSSSVNLKRIKFSMERQGHHTPMLFKDSIQIMAIFGDCLSRTPSLQNVEYLSDRFMFFDAFLPGHQMQDLQLPQDVLTYLINKFGSDLLKRIPAGDMLTRREEVIAILYQIMREAGGNLRGLVNLKLKLYNSLDMTAYKSFISGLHSLQNCHIDDESDPFEPGDANALYSLLVGQNPADDEEETPPSLTSLEELQVSRKFQDDPEANKAVSLNQLLERMKNLKSLDVVGKLAYGWRPEVAVHYVEIQEPNGNDDVDQILINVGDRFIQLPEFTIRPTPDQTVFHHMEVLKLYGVSLLTRDVPRLKTWINLKELKLGFAPGFHHASFGINSGDLIDLIVSLRKLDQLAASPVYFPQGNDRVAGAHQMALTQLGTLTLTTGRAHNHDFYRFVFENDVLNN